MRKSTAKLYLIPNTLGHNSPSEVMSKSIGKIIASLTAICGIAVIAIPIGIISAGFTESLGSETFNDEA